jgi:hypothetical protein
MFRALRICFLFLSIGCSQTIPGQGQQQMVDASAAGKADAETGGGMVDAMPDPDVMPAAPCVEGDARVEDPANGTCYVLFQTPQTWTAARDLCVGLGGTLANIESADEQAIVGPLAANYGGGEPDLWLGGSDVNTETQWLWTDGTAVVYTAWREGEPNNAGEEDCMIIEGDNPAKEWDDRLCTNSYPYICERP